MSNDIPARPAPAAGPAPARPQRYCVIGNPVAHSRSPWIHARFGALTATPVAYDARLVALDALAPTLAALASEGVLGCNITVPFKTEAGRLMHRLSDRALLAGAVNTVRIGADGLHGDNTDGAGLVADIERNAGIAIAGRRVLLVGAGGAAAGALGPLIAARAQQVVVANRTPERALALVERHLPWARAHDVVLEAAPLGAPGTAFDIVVNATAASLGGAGVPVPPTALRPRTLAFDMMYGPAAQPFVDWALAHGAVPRDGLGMLVEQAGEAFRVWHGVQPPTALVLDELRAEMRREAGAA